MLSDHNIHAFIFTQELISLKLTTSCLTSSLHHFPFIFQAEGPRLHIHTAANLLGTSILKEVFWDNSPAGYDVNFLF